MARPVQSSYRGSFPSSAATKSKIIFTILIVYSFASIIVQLGTQNLIASCSDDYAKASTRHDDIPVTSKRDSVRVSNFELHTSCAEESDSMKYNATISEMANHFQVKQDSWELTRKGSMGNGILSLHFHIMECPLRYSASTFHVQARTDETVFAGSVGDRYKVQNGCGYYNATVPIVILANKNNKTAMQRRICQDSVATSPSVIVEAFWTTAYRKYNNRIEDMRTSIKLYEEKDTLTPEHITEIIGPDRVEYITHHLDILPSFPVVLELPNVQMKEILPNCSDLAINDWLPVGVSTAESSFPRFQSSRCNYRSMDRQDLQYWFAGTRVRYLADSHGHFESLYVQKLTCPEAEDEPSFYEDMYRCSMQVSPKNAFAFANRYFLGVLKLEGGDHDGLSSTMRQVNNEVCLDFFGIGLYNATIITTSSWVFVYETSEGLYDYLQSLRNSIEFCREMYPEQMSNMVILVQTPLASDVILSRPSSEYSAEWRQNHNFRQEAFTHVMYKELGGLVDGIIPVFEWSLARNWMNHTRDGVHLHNEYYAELFHVQTMAIMSAMKSKGWQLPLMSVNDERTRWFHDVPLEYADGLLTDSDDSCSENCTEES